MNKMSVGQQVEMDAKVKTGELCKGQRALAKEVSSAVRVEVGLLFLKGWSWKVSLPGKN